MKRFAIAAGAIAIVAALLRYVCTPVRVRGHSMVPTFTDGQRVLAIRRRCYGVGDVIVFRLMGSTYRAGEPEWRLKRVAAVGGDRCPLQLASAGLPDTVPSGHLAVVGDSPRSQDSRQLGYIPVTDVAGRVRERIKL